MSTADLSVEPGAWLLILLRAWQSGDVKVASRAWQALENSGIRVELDSSLIQKSTPITKSHE